MKIVIFFLIFSCSKMWFAYPSYNDQEHSNSSKFCYTSKYKSTLKNQNTVLNEHYGKYFQVDGLKQQAQVNEMAGAGLILATVCMIVFEKRLLTYWEKFKRFCGKNNESLNETP